MMKVLVGETRSRKNIAALQELGWGRMFTVRPPTPYPYEPWGFDNGAFPAWLHGKNFPEYEFLKRLETAQDAPCDPYLAVVPDIVAGGLKSLQFSLEWRKELRDVEWPWYLAVQDGMEVSNVEPCLGWFDGIFLGGSDGFKAQAGRWGALAHKHQKRFHFGRASTPNKLVSAYRSGADSCDSAFPLWTAARMKEFGQRWTGLEEQATIQFSGLALAHEIV